MKMKLKDSDLVDSELSAIISRMPPELRLVGLKPEDRLKGLRTEEILKIIISKERLKELDPERLAAGQSKEALKKLKQLLDKLDLN